MVRAWIPNRGNVMAHRHGEAKLCDRLKLEGRDIQSNRKKAA